MWGLRVLLWVGEVVAMSVLCVEGILYGWEVDIIMLWLWLPLGYPQGSSDSGCSSSSSACCRSEECEPQVVLGRGHEGQNAGNL